MVDQFPARLFPIQHQIQELESELNAFNERIAELEMKVIEVMPWTC